MYTTFVDIGNNTKIELLEIFKENQNPNSSSPIENFLEKYRNGGIHHLCYQVDNLDAAISDLKSKNIRLLGDGKKIGAHGKPVIFLHPKDCNGILVEIEES